MQKPDTSSVVTLSQNVFSEGLTCAVAAGELTDRSAEVKTIAAPRYSAEALAQNIGGLGIDRVRLPGNGIQEILFRLR